MPRRKKITRERTASEIEFSELSHSREASTHPATPWTDEHFTHPESPFTDENFTLFNESELVSPTRRKRSRSTRKKGGYKKKYSRRRKMA